MKVHLVSASSDVHRLCYEVLGEMLGSGWTLHIAKGARPECVADLYIWDYSPTLMADFDFGSTDSWRHFFILSRTDLRTLRESVSLPDANLLLWPVSKAALSAFIADACARCKQAAADGDSADSSMLRADRDELLQCLIETNLKLQEYDQDRTNFLARAIHDFRAPLTAVSGYCGLLLGDDVGSVSNDQREVLERIQRSAKRLSRMAAAMFQLSIAPRIETALDLQKADIQEPLNQALEEMMPLMEDKQIAVNVDLQDASELLYFERPKLEQVIINLLDNACKFTPRGGSIDVKGYPYFWDRRLAGRTDVKVADRRNRQMCAPNAYRVDINDSGPGIPKAHLATIFEEYTSYGGGVDRSGGGLGLAICRMIMNQHRGCIWADSSGAGALFSIVLPYHRGDLGVSEQYSRRARAGAY